MQRRQCDGRQMHEAVDLLRRAAADEADGLLPVVEKAVAAAARVAQCRSHSDGLLEGEFQLGDVVAR